MSEKISTFNECIVGYLASLDHPLVASIKESVTKKSKKNEESLVSTFGASVAAEDLVALEKSMSLWHSS
jgi:hypothetical protein